MFISASSKIDGKVAISLIIFNGFAPSDKPPDKLLQDDDDVVQWITYKIFEKKIVSWSSNIKAQQAY